MISRIVLNEATNISNFECILYIWSRSLELSRFTCPYQHGPFLHSGIRLSYLLTFGHQKVDILDPAHGRGMWHLICARDKAEDSSKS